MRGDSELLLYGGTAFAPLLDDFCKMTDSAGDESRESALRVLSELLSMAGSTGFYGNLWHDFLARLIVCSENSYSLSAERRGAVEGGVRAFALHDMDIFREWFSADLNELADRAGVPQLGLISDYAADESAGMEYSAIVRERICSLAKELAECGSAEEMLDAADTFYRERGTGVLGLHKAFRIELSDGRVGVAPITRIADVRFDDLVGYERAKTLLKRNTEAFLGGYPANNCLLYGDAGTGKSSSIKALLNEYHDRGLRIIEVYRHEFKYLNDLIGVLKRRNYRFVLYMDDLSFEEFETEYKYLKAVIEGGLEEKPENVLIYATSNRRHLIRESFDDKAKLSDEDVHRSDTVQEKLSLYDRFGVTIYFGAPTPDEYKDIVRALARREGITMPEEELLIEANRWELKHAGYSGRTARQLIDDLLGRSGLDGGV